MFVLRLSVLNKYINSIQFKIHEMLQILCYIGPYPFVEKNGTYKI